MVNFPTKKQPVSRSYVAEVVGVTEGFVPNYGPEGRNGLYIEIQYDTTGKTRQIFYPDPPSMKTDKLFEALEQLGIDIDQLGGWEHLTGYKFRWENEITQREIFNRQTQKREMRSVQLEYPAEIISGEVSESAGLTGSEDGTTDSSASEESFMDEVMAVLDGSDGPMTLIDLRREAAKRDTIRQAPIELREQLSKGEITKKLLQQGRIKEELVDDPDGGELKVYSPAI